MQVEFVVLVYRDGRVVVAPDNLALEGTPFDPANIVSDVLSTGHGYMRRWLLYRLSNCTTIRTPQELCSMYLQQLRDSRIRHAAQGSLAASVVHARVPLNSTTCTVITLSAKMLTTVPATHNSSLVPASELQKFNVPV
jgi:hypothetical protein